MIMTNAGSNASTFSPMGLAPSLTTRLILESVRSHHLMVMGRGGDTISKEQFLEFCRSLGEISLWPFGEILDLKEQQDPEDHIFDCSYVPLHWDGMYRLQVPEFQVFQCVQAPLEDEGGETIFVNTKKLIEALSKDETAFLRSVVIRYERKTDVYNSCTVSPVLVKHPFRDYDVMRYCETSHFQTDRFLNHPRISIDSPTNLSIEELQRWIEPKLYDPRYCYRHKWQSGDIVIADNHTLLHGRSAFRHGSKRHLRRVHLLGQTLDQNPHLVSYL
jgi:L-tyrosine isonitrile desaturase/decarboxylase